MTTLQAIAAGLRRTLHSPGVVLVLWLVNVAAAVPATWIVAVAIRRSVGSSLVHENLRAGLDMSWYGQYEAYADGLARTFTPAILGVGAFLDNLEAWVTGGLFTGYAGLVALGVAYAIIWALLLGGVVDRYAHPDEARGAGRFFRSGGRYFLRFLRLAVLSGVLYVLIYWFHRWLYGVIAELVRNVTTERVVLLSALAAVGATAVLLTMVHLCFTYAKVATVMEDRRSMLLAALRGVAFVVAHPFRTFGIYLGVAVISVTMLVVYGFFGPGVGQTDRTGVIVAFAASQVFLIVRLALRLSALGGAAALYRSLTAGKAPAAEAAEPPAAQEAIEAQPGPA
jgi:hypothetical protein